ncbi:MAG: hypothetical protein JETT_2672 [Candidatus Jettenia ecosi]|uniref:Uncharacterized protein n=1 Tax=Candidatus Jettenia ecosi TaxID=2494326 RepID=A0A533Q8Q2_9BACT|nr:MAG: hypothetical protein JETT_2672 [Candidatus Jettenia ecosi]
MEFIESPRKDILVVSVFLQELFYECYSIHDKFFYELIEKYSVFALIECLGNSLCFDSVKGD